MTSAAWNRYDLVSTHESALRDTITAKLHARRATAVGHVELFMTEGCNHECDYCFVKEKVASREMAEDTGRAAIDFLLTYARRSGRCTIVFFGGEPLLKFPLIRSLVEYALQRVESTGSERPPSFSITTNGTLLTEEMAGFFRSHGIFHLLSIDGDRSTHDSHRRMVGGRSSYDAVMERFGMLKKYQPWQGARVTVHPEFSGQVRENVEHLARIGINQFIIGPASGVPWPESDLCAYEHSLLEALKWVHQMKLRGAPLRLHLLEEDPEAPPGKYKGRWGCGAGRGRMSVDVDGNIYPCSKIYGVDSPRTTWLLGDVWRGITDYRRRALFLSQASELRPKCASCDLRDDCCGGCPANNLEATGSPFDPCELDCAMTCTMIRLRKELAEYIRAHPEPKAKPTFFSGLKHIRAVA